MKRFPKDRSRAAIRSEAEYHAVFEGANEPLAIIDEDTTIAAVNRRFEAMTGYGRDEVEGKSFLPLVAEEDRDRAMEIHRTRRESSQSYQPLQKVWVVTKDGRRLLAEVSGAMIAGSKRSVVGLRDITESHVLREQLERQNRMLEFLQALASLLSSSSDLASMLEPVLDLVTEISDTSWGAIYVLDEEQGLTLRAFNKLGSHNDEMDDRLNQGKHFEQRVARTGSPVFIRDIGDHQHLTKLAFLGNDSRAFACVPVVSSHKVWGVLSVSSSDPRDFSPEERGLLTAIGQQIGMAVERAEHLERARDRAHEASSLMLVSLELASSLDVQTVLARTLAIMCMQVWADLGGVCLFDPATERVALDSSWGESAVAEGTEWELGQGVAGWVAAHQIPILCDDVATDDRVELSIAPVLGYHSMIGVPLRTSDKLLGVVVAASRKIGAFSKSNLRLLSAYAQQASQFLEKAMLHEQLKIHASNLSSAIAEIAASEHRFRALVEHSSDAVLLLNPEGNCIYASPPASRISGFAIEDFVGSDIFAMIHPEDRDRARALLDHVAGEPARVVTSELRAFNKEGRTAWIEVTVSNLLFEPSVGALVVNWRDISGRKRMEGERERLTAILEAASDIIVLCDMKGKLLYANKAGREAFGEADDDGLLERTIIDLVQDDTRLRISNEILPAVMKNGRWAGELVSRGPNGRPIATLVVAQAHRGAAGEIQFVSAIARDITELRGVASALEAASQEWRTTFDGITEGILVLDNDRRVLKCNSAMATFLGLRFDEILGRRCCDLICATLGSQDDCTNLRVLQTRRKETSVVQIADQWFAVTTYPLETRRNVNGGIVHIMSNVTEQKYAEEALRASASRIRSLAEASVRAQEEERQWVADEVHDRIAQTLVAVHQHLQALKSAVLDDDPNQRLVIRALELQGRANHETRNIMRDLYLPTLDQYGLATVIRDELDELERNTGCQTVLEAHLPDRLPRHIEGVFFRIFHEALVNVRKHCAEVRSVKVSIQQGPQRITMVVEDDGPGFDAEAAVQSERLGGLVSMRRRAEIIGGTFQVASNPGRGSRISISVPVEVGRSADKAKIE